MLSYQNIYQIYLDYTQYSGLFGPKIQLRQILYPAPSSSGIDNWMEDMDCLMPLWTCFDDLNSIFSLGPKAAALLFSQNVSTILTMRNTYFGKL